LDKIALQFILLSIFDSYYFDSINKMTTFAEQLETIKEK